MRGASSRTLAVAGCVERAAERDRLDSGYGLGRTVRDLRAAHRDDEGVTCEPSRSTYVGVAAQRTLEDGIHPNRAGHERIAQNVAEPLEALLASLDQERR